MPRLGLHLSGLLVAAAMASAAVAQQGVQWQHDIEAAKAAAKQSNRLVLVHVWADGCAPCKALDSNVFNQSGVAGAVEAKFVPVKLNANEFPATAQGFGITGRVPTDVILTPDGTVIGKMISPATPSAYVAELTQAANQYHSQSGQAFQVAANAASQPSKLNAAYADLAIGAPALPEVPMAVTSTQQNPTSSPYLPAQSASVALAPSPTPVQNTYSDERYGSTTPVAAPPTPTPPAQTANPYMAYGTPAAPATAASMTANPYSQLLVPAAPPAVGAVPQDTSVPPAYPGATPVSEEAKRPATSPPQQTTASVTPTPIQQLPPGAPPLGFDGFCPVTMRNSWKWVPGNAKFGAIHRGRTYLFIGPLEQQQFLANPDHYSPALAGVDPVLAIDHKQSVPGLREHSLDFDNQFFLFSSEATLQQFTANPQRYASGVREAMGIRPGQQTR